MLAEWLLSAWGAVAVAGAGAGAGAAAASAGAAADLGCSVIAPSQPGAAVAGVQELLRQHSPEEFFQTSPAVDSQLLISPADVKPANASEDTAIKHF